MTSYAISNPARHFLYPCAFVVVGLFLGTMAAHASDTFRVDIDSGASAVFRSGGLFLECRPPGGGETRAFFKKYLANPGEWKVYKNSNAAAVRFDHLNPESQRRVLLAVFSQDYVDGDGWRHTVTFSDTEGHETVKLLCEWLTGKGANSRKVLADKHNKGIENLLLKGQQVLIRKGLLLDVMRAPSPRPAPPEEPAKEEPAPKEEAVAAPASDEVPADLDALARELTYGSDAKGAYASYRLKQGEALYTAVVVRFTDMHDNADILAACETIRERSGIKNVHGMKTGQKILIPMDMLSDRFRPKDSEQRKEFEETISEAKRLRKEQVHTKALDGVVVVIDPGHGGRDQGCAKDSRGLYEDGINYDIACRVKQILETQTRAKVYMTVLDRQQKYAPSDRKRFMSHTDKVVLTTPPYPNKDAKVSVNLRWYLANAIYRDEVAKGTDPRKMVFTSFHTDALYNAELRGAMMYIPGAKYRRESEEPKGINYAQYKEARGHRTAESTAAERRRDEALSRNFAEDIMTALGKKKIRRHLEGDWIRSQIRQEGGRVYVPSVLRNTLIPTKVLIEAANMTNDSDCERLASSEWRQAFAEAYVDALKSYLGS